MWTVLATLASPILAQGQGSFIFGNLVPTANPPIDAPVYDDGVRLAGSAYLAQTYVGVTASSLSATGVPVVFRTGASAGYITSTTVVAGFSPGSTVVVEMRAWDGSFATYEAALAAGAKTGKSVQISLILGGGPFIPPPAMVGLQSFALASVGVIFLTRGIPDIESGTPPGSASSQQLCTSTIVGTLTQYVQPTDSGPVRVYTKNSPFPATLAAFNTYAYMLDSPMKCGDRQGNDATLEFQADKNMVYPIVIGRLSGTGTKVDITYELLPMPVTVTGILVSNKVYDATTSAALDTSGATLVGVLQADASMVTLVTSSVTGAFADKNIGTAKPVAISGLSLGGSAAANYAITQPLVHANITPASLVAKADNKTRLQGTANPMFTGTINGVQNGDTITATYNCSATPASIPGNYMIVPTPLDPGGNLGNYAVTANNGVLTILENTTRIRFASFPTSGGLSLSCDTLTGSNYTLESKDSLTGSTWANVDSLIGNGGAVIFNDSRPRVGSRIYRVRIETIP